MELLLKAHRQPLNFFFLPGFWTERWSYKGETSKIRPFLLLIIHIRRWKTHPERGRCVKRWSSALASGDPGLIFNSDPTWQSSRRTEPFRVLIITCKQELGCRWFYLRQCTWRQFVNSKLYLIVHSGHFGAWGGTRDLPWFQYCAQPSSNGDRGVTGVGCDILSVLHQWVSTGHTLTLPHLAMSNLCLAWGERRHLLSLPSFRHRTRTVSIQSPCSGVGNRSYTWKFHKGLR